MIFLTLIIFCIGLIYWGIVYWKALIVIAIAIFAIRILRIIFLETRERLIGSGVIAIISLLLILIL